MASAPLIRSVLQACVRFWLISNFLQDRATLWIFSTLDLYLCACARARAHEISWFVSVMYHVNLGEKSIRMYRVVSTSHITYTWLTARKADVASFYLEAVWRFNDRTKSRTLPNSEAMWEEAGICAGDFAASVRAICEIYRAKYNSDIFNVNVIS